MGSLNPGACVDNWRVARRVNRREAKVSGNDQKELPGAIEQVTNEGTEAAQVFTAQVFAEQFCARLARISNGPQSIRNHANEIQGLDGSKTIRDLQDLGLFPLPRRGGRLAEVVKAIITLDTTLAEHRHAIAEHLRSLNIQR